MFFLFYQYDFESWRLFFTTLVEIIIFRFFLVNVSWNEILTFVGTLFFSQK